MITRPSPAELLNSVRIELKERLAPEVNSPQAHAALAMADTILGHVQVMVNGELGWIRDEMDVIDKAAEALIAVGADRNGRIAEALVASKANRSNGWDMSAARNDYRAASEVLSRCLEEGLRHGDEARDIAEAALEQRVDRELQIKGALAFASRVEQTGQL